MKKASQVDQSSKHVKQYLVYCNNKLSYLLPATLPAAVATAVAAVVAFFVLSVGFVLKTPAYWYLQ